MGEAFDPGGRAGEQDRAAPAWNHAPRGLLGDEKGAERADLECALDGGGIELSERALDAGARVVDDDVGFADAALCGLEERGDGCRLRRVGGDRRGAGLCSERRELLGVAGGEGDLDAERCQTAGERGADFQGRRRR